MKNWQNIGWLSKILSHQKSIFLLYLVPPFIAIIFVNFYAVNVPYWDQWDWMYVFEKFHNNTLSFADLYRQHYEHRMLIPRLFYILFASLSRWNTILESHVSLFILCINFILIYALSQATVIKKKFWLFHLTNFVSCVILFSINQYESLLRGEQFAWFFINFCLISALFSLHKLNNFKKVLIAAIFCSLASFSSSHGLITWVALFPSIIITADSKQHKYKQGVLWGVLFLICTGLYFYQWELTITTNPRGNLFILENPLQALFYFTIFVGAPLTLHNQEAINLISPETQIIASIIGTFLLFLFMRSTVIILKNKSLQSNAILWISLGLFSILIAFFTTVGRASYSTIHAFLSRYITYSRLLIIALVQLWGLYLQSSSYNQFKAFLTQLYKLVLGFILAWFMVLSMHTLTAAQITKETREHSYLCLDLLHFLDINLLEKTSASNCMNNLYRSIPELKEKAEILEKIGWRNFPEKLSFIKKTTFDYGALEVENSSRVEVAQNSKITISGWAVLPNSPAKIVLLSYNNRPNFFTTAYVNLPSPEIAKQLQSNLYHHARWSVDFVLVPFPLGQGTITAWVYHRDAGELVKLDGELEITIVEE